MRPGGIGSSAPAFSAAAARGTWGSGAQSLRVESRSSVEIHLAARPDAVTGGFEAQARSMYARLLEELHAQGSTPSDVVAERFFLDDAGEGAPRLAAVREEFYGGGEPSAVLPAATWVRQPPAAGGRLCEMQAVALRAASGKVLPRRGLPLSGRGSGVVFEAGGLRHVVLSGVTSGPAGDGSDSQGEAATMFRAAETALGGAGLSFLDVVRTWIFVADIARDYAGMNRARREFFRSRGVRTPPASTGIQGVPLPPDRACAIDLRGLRGTGPLRVAPFGSPTMNEAASYGADFARGTRVDLEDRSVLYVSGTASIDAEGRVVGPGDIDAQVERMFLNVEALLSGQGAAPTDIVSSVTYLKDAAHAGAFLGAAARRGFPDSAPGTLCVADICRPEWLCEIEVTAVLA